MPEPFWPKPGMLKAFGPISQTPDPDCDRYMIVDCPAKQKELRHAVAYIPMRLMGKDRALRVARLLVAAPGMEILLRCFRTEAEQALESFTNNSEDEVVEQFNAENIRNCRERIAMIDMALDMVDCGA